MIYKSCEALEQGIAFMHDDVRVCCNDSHAGGGFENNPFFLYSDLKEFSWENYFEYKNLIRSENQDQVYPLCKQCLYLEHKDWGNVDNTKLSYFNFNHWRTCDTKCIYCDVWRAPNKKENYIHSIYPYLKKLAKKGLIQKEGMVMFGGGDISFLPEFEKIVKLFIRYNYNFNIATSATHYMPILKKLLQLGCIELRISVDSAREETYKRIKCTNFYKQVWKNIILYSKAQSCPYSLRLKYIIIPGINDNEYEILEWLKMSKEAGVKSVILDIESGYYKKEGKDVPERIIKLFEYAKNEAEKLGLYFMIFDHASQMLSLFDNYLSENYFTEDITQHKLRDYKKNKKDRRNFFCIKKIKI